MKAAAHTVYNTIYVCLQTITQVYSTARDGKATPEHRHHDVVFTLANCFYENTWVMLLSL
jgi:hypothetical protein